MRKSSSATPEDKSNFTPKNIQRYKTELGIKQKNISPKMNFSEKSVIEEESNIKEDSSKSEAIDDFSNAFQLNMASN